MSQAEEDEFLWEWIQLTSDVEDLGQVNGEKDAQSVRSLNVQCAGRNVELQVVITDYFPLQLPTIRVHPPHALGVLPHVDPEGIVCVFDSEGVLLNSEKPEAILEEAVKKAQEVIAAGLEQRNVTDFTDEFEAYWAPLHPHRICVLLHAALGEAPCRVTVTQENNAQRFVVSERELSEKHRSHIFKKLGNVYQGVYVPLTCISPLVPPERTDTHWTNEQLHDLLNTHVSSTHRSQLTALFDLLPQRRHFLILGVRRTDGKRTFFGVGWCAKPHSKRGPRVRFPLFPLDNTTQRQRIASISFPLVFRRVDAKFLIERGGGHLPLLSRHVIVVGCGAVGSVVADLIVKAGVGRISLVDFDVLELGNIHRNQLGAQYEGISKAVALRSDLAVRFPHLETTAYPERVEALLQRTPTFFDDADLVIFATGNHTVELEMNERMHARRSSPAALHTWLEPLGLGGHALLTNIAFNADRSGCFKCLFEDRDDGIFWNKASFAAPNQSFTKRTSGCLTSFVSYGGIDATRTACLAADIARRFLIELKGEHSLRSWRGESNEFEEQGYRLSDRYTNSTQDSLDRQCLEYKSITCPICHPYP